MKKLLLTAYGFSTDSIKNAALDLVDGNFNSCNACIISTSWPIEKEKHPQMQQVKNELLALGVDKVDFVDVEFQDAHLLNNYQLIFLNGGYPFFLLHHLEKSGADKIIKKMAANGTLIIGLSAGSIVMGPDLSLMDYLYPEDNLFNVKNLTALNLTTVRIFPHYKEMITRDKDITKKLLQFEKHFNQPLNRLNNDQAILVTDNKTEIINS
ncbi:Type 1 glutamine amidotransferase-like domain-containing protein [Enterococcus lactis]|uniref:Type 1 glutamine amidotransferase-like domain-containing protein n=1 Tax=Enterococcus lactis TaxID=357441 RepID=UPI0022B1524B|nr:Type 1 glutamine amidotransferase-like domain-containing protein [Enterococcus lactis]